MNVYKITYDSTVTWRCVLAKDIQEAIDIFSKEVNQYRTTEAKIISVETITTNILYNSAKIETKAYKEGYKDGRESFFHDMNMLYDKLK